MSPILKGFRFIFSIYGILVFVFFMLLLFPFFMIAFFREPVKGGNMIYFLARLWADLFFFFTGIRYINIKEGSYDPEREYIFVSNHISYMDIPMMMKVFRKQHFRILGKSTMNKIPIFGAIYKNGTVSVDRSDSEGRANSVKRLIEFINEKISVFICPEGTFNMTHKPLKEFFNGAFKIAIETQKPIKPVLFLDTYDRLNYKSIFSLNPGKCRAVYLPETITEGLRMEDMDWLKEKIYLQMEEALVRYEATWIEIDR